MIFSIISNIVWLWRNTREIIHYPQMDIETSPELNSRGFLLISHCPMEEIEKLIRQILARHDLSTEEGRNAAYSECIEYAENERGMLLDPEGDRLKKELILHGNVEKEE